MPFVGGHALSRRALHGGNAKNARIASHNIAARLRGGLLPQADVYPRKMRATRARLRRSNHLMRKRAELDAHMQTTASQYHRGDPVGRIAKPQNRRGRRARCEHRCGQPNMAVDLALSACDDPRLAELAADIAQTARGHAPVSLARLRTSPGVGTLVALVRLYEREDLARFPRGQAVVSSCRLGKRARAANGKRHGTSGTKIGNAHLKWACSEAAVLVLTHNEPAQKYRATLANRHGTGTALSSLAHQRGRAVSFRLQKQIACDQEKFLATEAGGNGPA